MELRGLVVGDRATLDLLLLGEEALQLGIGFLHQRLGLDGRVLALGAAASGRRAGHDPAGGTRAAGGLADGHGGLTADLVLAAALVREDVALVEPHLHADAAGGGAGLAEAVVDVGAQRVQRHPTLAVPLGAGHLGATEAAGALHPDAEGAGLLGALHGALHGPAEGHAAGELVGHALGDQRGVELRLLDLLDVELHLVVAGDGGEPGAEAVGLGAAAADDDAGAGGVHVDPEAVTGALDLHAADGGVGQLRHEEVADLPVLDDEVAVLLAIGEPARLPLGGDPEPEPIGVDLLTHHFCSSFGVVAPRRLVSGLRRPLRPRPRRPLRARRGCRPRPAR